MIFERTQFDSTYILQRQMSVFMNSRDEFIPTRQSLLSRLKDWGDQDSWRVFFDTYWKLVYSTSIKAGLTDAEAQDAVQETVISVMKSMPNFQYDPAKGSFKSWLLRLTKWRIADQLRKRQRGIEQQWSGPGASSGTATGDEAPGEPVDVEHLLKPGTELDAIWDEEWEKNLMDAALERVKRKVAPEHYQIFYLHSVKSMPAGDIAQLLGASMAKVYVVRHRVARMVRREVQTLARRRP